MILSVMPSAYFDTRTYAAFALLSVLLALVLVRALRVERAWWLRATALLIATALAMVWIGFVVGATGVDARYIGEHPTATDHQWRDSTVERIPALSPYDARDYEFLRGAVADRRFVLLGENSHYVREYSQLKANIIRFLHEEMGFGVLVFESGFLGCHLVNEVSASTAPDSVMRSLYSVWHTPETRDLFAWILDTRADGQELTIGGLDGPRSAGQWEGYWNFLARVAAPSDEMASLVAASQREFGAVGRGHGAAFPTLETLARQFDDLSSQSPYNRAQDARFAAQVARNLLADEVSEARRQEKRDSTMAANFIFLAEKAYPAERIIVWAHNAHIDRALRSKRLDDWAAWLVAWSLSRSIDFRGMGERLHDRYGRDLYVVALLMGSGRYRATLGGTKQVRPARRDSIERMVGDPHAAAAFVDLTGIADRGRRHWAHSPAVTLYSGMYWYRLIPADHFDGIFVVSDVHPSRKL